MSPWYHVVMVSPSRGVVQLLWRCVKHQLVAKQRDYFLAPRCPKCEEEAK